MSPTASFSVRLTPRGGVDRIEGEGPAGELRVRVRAPAVDGAANEALLRLIADELDVPRWAVTLDRGHTSRTKTLRLTGVSAGALRDRWPRLEVR